MADREGFEAFVRDAQPRLARALVASYGLERGHEAIAEALAYAWEHFERLSKMANPIGYLFRVGQSRTRRRPATPRFPPPAEMGLPHIEPNLGSALLELTERQRVCVVLVHVYEWTHQEVADLLELSRSSVQNHTERGLGRLRVFLGVTSDA